MDYVIITPVRNEEKYIENTILSVINQTVKPLEWVIVDDGSSDETGLIIDRFAAKIKWISSIHRKDRGFRKSGGGVIEAFYDGYNHLSADKWDFIVKLDGDLLFSATYFERCLTKFSQEPRLGIGGGTIYNLVADQILSESNPAFHVRGATKIYRRLFWLKSGGLLKAPGWDTLDEVKANMLGWTTKSFPDINLYQQKVTGSADGSWKNAFKNGKGSFIAGYHPAFMLFRCVNRLSQMPYGIQSLGLMAGFLSGYLQRLPRIEDKELIMYLRRQQLKRLLLQKSIWK